MTIAFKSSWIDFFLWILKDVEAIAFKVGWKDTFVLSSQFMSWILWTWAWGWHFHGHYLFLTQFYNVAKHEQHWVTLSQNIFQWERWCYDVENRIWLGVEVWAEKHILWQPLNWTHLLKTQTVTVKDTTIIQFNSVFFNFLYHSSKKLYKYIWRFCVHPSLLSI